jgi:hypothetical protein
MLRPARREFQMSPIMRSDRLTTIPRSKSQGSLLRNVRRAFRSYPLPIGNWAILLETVLKLLPTQEERKLRPLSKNGSISIEISETRRAFAFAPYFQAGFFFCPWSAKEAILGT